MGELERKIEELGFVLPECPKPVASYVVAVEEKGLIYASGQTPVVDGILKYQGKVGQDVTVEQAYDAASICALRLIAELKSLIGDLDRIHRIVKVSGYVNGIEGFKDHPQVINGASDLIVKIFGDKGKHARIAIGVQSLPDNAPVEVELIASITS